MDPFPLMVKVFSHVAQQERQFNITINTNDLNFVNVANASYLRDLCSYGKNGHTVEDC